VDQEPITNRCLHLDPSPLFPEPGTAFPRWKGGTPLSLQGEAQPIPKRYAPALWPKGRIAAPYAPVTAVTHDRRTNPPWTAGPGPQRVGDGRDSPFRDTARLCRHVTQDGASSHVNGDTDE
jgi:hypothetical protein